MSSFEDTDMISDAEKLQIAQHFLLSSPPGQFNEVLSDVKKLVPDHVLTDSVVENTAKAFNTKTLRVATTPSGKKAVVNPKGEVDTTHFKDNDSAVYAVDHVSMTTTDDGTQASESNDSIELYRAALQSSIDEYISTRFHSEQSAGTVVAAAGQLHVFICTEKPNLRNFWSGKWTSSWSIEFSGESASVSGEIKIHAHYFEDGNVQMVTNKSIPAHSISFSSESVLASAVVSHIKNSESALQTGLEDMYSNMSEETVKSLRRTMPITRSKMDWNLNSVRMIRQVRK